MLIEQLRRAIQMVGTKDLSLLDIGAGVGAIHHVLLNGTVSRVTHIDASPGQLAAAREETQRRGHTGAVRFIEGDFTALAGEVADADIVTMDRVICCFDDMEQLVPLSAAKAMRFFGAVYPRDVGLMHIRAAAINFVGWLRRSPFRSFLHDPSRIDALLRAAGLELWSEQHTVGWTAVVYRRTD